MIQYNTSIPTQGLVALFDAKNVKSNPPPPSTNQLSWASWTVGTGNVTGYSVNGDGNSRLLDTNPWGHTDVVWDVSNQDATSDADGGWNPSVFYANDVTKMYRYSTFVRRKTLGNGTFYMGLSPSNTSLIRRSNGATDTNPYFTYNAWGSFGNVLNDWFLVVGHVWPLGSGTGSRHPDSGIYNMSGTKIADTIEDYVWTSPNPGAGMRTYLYYSTDTTTNQQWYQPRIDVMDGTQPSIAQLLNTSGIDWKNCIPSGSAIKLYKQPTRNSDHWLFDGVNDYGLISPALNFGTGTTQWSVNAWVKTTVNTTSLGQGSILSNANSGPVYSSLCVNSGKIAYWVYQSGAWAQKLGNKIVNDNNWHMLTWVQYSNNTMDLYVDGVFDANVANSSVASTNSIDMIGGSWNSKFPGSISKVEIYNRSLTANEIRNCYEATRGRFGL